MLAYSPQHPDIYAVPATPLKPITSSSLPTDNVVVQPVTIRVGLTDKMTPCLHSGTSCSIRQLGGIQCFLFLFAKVCNTLC